jgi:AraC-like DNA-binding protein
MHERRDGDAVRQRGSMRGRLCLWPEGILFHGSNVRTTGTRPSTATVVFARSGQLRVRVGPDPTWVPVRCAVLAPNVPQQVESVDGDLVMLKIDPETDAFARVRTRVRDRPMHEPPDEIAFELAARTGPWLKGPAFSPERVWQLAVELIGDAKTPQNRFDPRIARVLAELKERFRTTPSAAELGSSVGLSEGRLTHLFTKEVGVPVRRYVLWLRLRHAVWIYMLTRSLTEAAHDAGFTDSAHLSRSFRSLFGIRPSAVGRQQGDIRVVVGLPTGDFGGPHAAAEASRWAAAAAAFAAADPSTGSSGPSRWFDIAAGGCQAA